MSDRTDRVAPSTCSDPEALTDAELQEEGGARAGPERRGRVYVVDDDATMLSTLARVLLRAGYAVETYATAQAFLDRARPEPACCLLLDIRMPGLSGLDLQELLARDEGRCGPDIVFMAGSASVPDAVRAMKGGAVDLLEKPFGNARLLEAVAVALTRSGERAAARAAQGAAREHLARLTHRERQVCELIATGRTNRAISVELGLAESTVSLHRAHVMKKLRVRAVAELVRLVDLAGRPR